MSAREKISMLKVLTSRKTVEETMSQITQDLAG